MKKPTNPNNMDKQMTAVEWLYSAMLPTALEFEAGLITLGEFTAKCKEYKQQAKALEREQHGYTWDDAIQAHEDRGRNIVRSSCDFDDYFTKTYGDNVKNDLQKP